MHTYLSKKEEVDEQLDLNEEQVLQRVPFLPVACAQTTRMSRVSSGDSRPNNSGNSSVTETCSRTRQKNPMKKNRTPRTELVSEDGDDLGQRALRNECVEKHDALRLEEACRQPSQDRGHQRRDMQRSVMRGRERKMRASAGHTVEVRLRHKNGLAAYGPPNAKEERQGETEASAGPHRGQVELLADVGAYATL